MSTQFDLAQSFYLDKGAVADASVVHITSVELYLETKPEAGNSTTGLYKPGISVYLCPILNDQPQLNRVVQGSRARVEWDDINTSELTEVPKVATKFSFERPVIVATDTQYAILIKIDGGDPGFSFYWGESGKTYLNSTYTASINSGYNDGAFYVITNGSVLTKNPSADLQFHVNVAKFNPLTNTYLFKERGYELIKYLSNSYSTDLITGEYVYQNTAALTGSITSNSSSLVVVGTGGTTFDTTFAVGSSVVISDSTPGNTFIRFVDSVASASSMTLDEQPHVTAAGLSYYNPAIAKVYIFDKKSDYVILTDSTANSTVYFDAADVIKGEDSRAQLVISQVENFDIGRVTSQLNVVVPSQAGSNASIEFANTVYGTQTISTNIPVAKRQFIDSYDAMIGSQSLVKPNLTNNLFTGNVSVNGSLVFTTQNAYTSPYIAEDDLDILVYRYIINNDATGEEQSNGNATSRYISKKVVLGNEQDAEDLRVYTSAYIPTQTNIKIYAQLLNGEDYESSMSKNWSLLEEVNQADYVSSSQNKDDVVEREYQIPNYYTDGTLLAAAGGMVTPNNVIRTSADISSNVTVNSTLIRVYQEGSPNNFFVSLVTAANSISITVADTVSNTSFNSNGLQIEKVSDANKFSAFINPQNSNIARYYTNGLAPVDTYKQFALKVVLLSPYTFSVPLIKDVRAIAVSA